MPKNKKIIASLFIIGLIIAYISAMSGREPVSQAQLDAKTTQPVATNYHDLLQEAKRQLSLPDTIYLISAASDELTGDNVTDDILLIGAKVAGDDSIAEDIDLILRNGKTGQFTAAGLRGLASSQTGIFFGDFNADTVKDVLITAPGQGNNLQHAMVSFAGGQPETLFNGSSTAHEFTSKQMKSQYASVSYPQVEQANSATREFINKTLESTASELLNRATPQHPINVGYTIVRSDAALLSVVFNDEQDIARPILQSVTINLRSQRVILLDSLTSDRQARQSILSLVDTAAKTAGMTDVPKLDEWTGFYLTEKGLVFYQQKPDNAPLQLEIPLDKARALLIRSTRG
jgi:hypothetical protein